MATTSYGKITIIDVTDVGNFSVYPYANGPNTQIYSEENAHYYPDWGAQDTNNNYISPLILTPVVTYAGQDKTTESTVNWYLKTEIERAKAANPPEIPTPISTGGAYTVDPTYKTLTITSNISTANTYIVYVVKAHYISETGAEVEAEGEITFSLLTQPSSIKGVDITGTNVIKYASDSSTPSPSTVTLTANLTGGDNIIGVGWKYWNGSAWMPSGNSYMTTGTPSGVTVNNQELQIAASYDNSKAYFNADTARFKYIAHAAADSTDIYEDIFTVFQLRDGASGSKIVAMDLTNDDQIVPINQSDIPQWASLGDLASTTVHIYEGSDDITSNTSKVSNLKATLTNVTVELYNGSTLYTDTWNNGSNLPTGYYTVKVTGFTNNATTGSVRFDANVNNLPYSKTFSLVGQKAGVDGQTPKIYALDFPSIPAYVNNPTGSAAAGTLVDNWSYSPANLTIKAYEITTDSNGVSSRNLYGGRIYYTPKLVNGVPEESDGVRTWGILDLPTSGANKGIGTLAADTYLSADYSPYTFRLVAANASNTAANIKDEENINIVSDGYIGNAGNDGNDGDDAINLLLTNENFTLTTTSENKTRAQVITSQYQGYKGIATNNNFSLVRSGDNIVAGTSYECKVGSTTNNSLISVTENINNKTVTITFTANQTVAKGSTGTITLHFKYTGVTPNLSIDKVITWEAKPDAINGIDGASAIYLTFEYGGNKTTYFKNEVGSTKVTPVLLQNGANLLSGKTVGTDYSVIWTDLISGNTVTLDTDDITAVITAANISGVGSYSCEVSYPLSDGTSNGNTKIYTQYISFTDYSDPLQVELISTVGDKLTNGVGEGVVYPQTTRDGNVLDQVSTNSIVVWGSASAPSNPANGDFYFNTSDNKLYERVSNSWTARSSYAQVIVLNSGSNVNPIVVRNIGTSTYPNVADFSTLTYIWSFRDKDGQVVNPNNLTDLRVSHIDATHSAVFTSTQVTGGQFIYINKNVISNKIIILCQVTKN